MGIQVHRALLAARLTNARAFGDAESVHWCGCPPNALQARLQAIYCNQAPQPAGDEDSGGFSAVSSRPRSAKCTHALSASIPIVYDSDIEGLLRPRGTHIPLARWPRGDCEISSMGAVWTCHRAVLAARSEYFNAAFMPRWMSDGARSVALPVDVSKPVVDALLEYLYSSSTSAVAGLAPADGFGLLGEPDASC